MAALTSLNRIYAEFKDKGLEVISFDQDRDAAKATEYLARHHYQWKKFHDEDRKVATALQSDGFPLALLIDANGKIIYFDFGGEDAGLRNARCVFLAMVDIRSSIEPDSRHSTLAVKGHNGARILVQFARRFALSL